MDIKAYIEIPLGSSVKYEVDEETGELTVDRFLHTAMSYPFNYGYVKGTKGKDGDPVDVCVFSSQSVAPGVIMKCHVIGLLEMEDEGGPDAKLFAVPDIKIDPIFGVWASINNVPEIIKAKTKHFFDHMKELEPGKWVKTGGFKDAKEAEKEIESSKV
ncbi:MAG: inorganic diphosphatase [Patescibacteria group bacterium]